MCAVRDGLILLVVDELPVFCLSCDNCVLYLNQLLFNEICFNLFRILKSTTLKSSPGFSPFLIFSDPLFEAGEVAGNLLR